MAEGENLKKQEYVRKSLEGISRAGEQLAGVSRSLGQTEFVKSAREELQSDRALVYRAPVKPRTRAEIAGSSTERTIDADTESSGVVLHKDSKWIAAWENFKDNNQYVQKFFDLKTRYEESDHLLVRSLRFVTDKISDLIGSKGSENELQTVLEEITKIDPSFTIENFIRYCRLEVIPNVLESIVHGHLDVLKDWCYEAPFNVLSAPIKQTQELGFHMDSRILDVHNIDVHMGKMMEQGPVLIITFQAQQIQCVRDSSGAVKEGDPEKVLRVTHVWALCRDQSELNPWTAWRILDVAMMPAEQWV
uniref:Tim44 domain-containing protein n=1 Tax=Mesocestoides corti TaxID=53468 RepID=A0A5K3EPT9_MESCO